jgi:hypothetical protein
MAINAKQRQKKLEKKNKKRKLAKKSFTPGIPLREKAVNYAKFPIHECLVPSALFETGIGNIIVARRTQEGVIAASAFVVDVFCLGIKNALFNISSEFKYENTMKPKLIGLHQDKPFEKVHPTCARKLIEGAVFYAKEMGFSPHRDYKDVKSIFGNIEGSACPVKYIYGSDGKPFYIRGPNESTSQANRIVDQLHKKCGDGNYNYLFMIDENMGE